jgi:hypothetical protein
MMDVLRIHGGQAWAVHRHEAPVFDVFDRDALVYLSPDSPNVLTHVCLPSTQSLNQKIRGLRDVWRVFTGG